MGSSHRLPGGDQSPLTSAVVETTHGPVEAVSLATNARAFGNRSGTPRLACRAPRPTTSRWPYGHGVGAFGFYLIDLPPGGQAPRKGSLPNPRPTPGPRRPLGPGHQRRPVDGGKSRTRGSAAWLEPTTKSGKGSSRATSSPQPLTTLARGPSGQRAWLPPRIAHSVECSSPRRMQPEPRA